MRFLVIGVAGANYYARSAGLVFTTLDRDLFLPPDPANLLRAWRACVAEGLELSAGDEPLGLPLDRFLAEQVAFRCGLVQAVGEALQIDLALEMAGFEFHDVWPSRRLFRVEGVSIPVASLEHIVKSNAALGRPEYRLFLASHAQRMRSS